MLGISLGSAVFSVFVGLYLGKVLVFIIYYSLYALIPNTCTLCPVELPSLSPLHP